MGVSKGFDGFGPVSPFTPKPALFSRLTLRRLPTRTHSQWSHSTTGYTIQHVVHITELIHYLSTLFTLRPGDILFTGTPSGVSQVQAGDQCRAILRNEAGELASRLDVEIKAAQ